MPRRLPIKPDRFIGNLFIILVFSTLCVIYFSVVIKVLLPLFFKSDMVKILLAFYHFLVFMLIWCLIQTILGDPGQVPTFWGFHFGDHESKRKRYCLMCNVFKPERCHHCSNCNRCVLNMDHHCPWVNNCIGFWNRKQFVLLLIYVLICAYISAIILTVDLYYRLNAEYEYFTKTNKVFDDFFTLIVVLIAEVITCAASFIMTNFLKFHIMLILDNKTTIEFLEKKGEKFDSVYNISPRHNWIQVFGYNKLLWFFPVSCYAGHPVGDGIYWQINPDIKQANAERQATLEAGNSQRNKQGNDNDQEKLISQNESHKVNNEENNSENKENISVQRSHQISSSSRDSAAKFDLKAMKDMDKKIDTVVNRKDDNNTLIVHSQDNKLMLKNTLIKNN